MTDTIDAAGIVAGLVKPLKWHNYDAWTWWAEAICGTYHVEERHGFWKADLRFRDAVHVVYEIDDYETAIAAAEADYRARIAAALDVGPILALVGAVMEEAAGAIKPVDVDGDARYFRVPGFHAEGCIYKDDDLLVVVSGLIDRIRALRPDAAAALERVRQEARNAALEEAAELLDREHGLEIISKGRNPEDYISRFSRIAARIRALTTPAQPQKGEAE